MLSKDPGFAGAPLSPWDAAVLCPPHLVYPGAHPAHVGDGCGSLSALATGFEVIALVLPWAAYF